MAYKRAGVRKGEIRGVIGLDLVSYGTNGPLESEFIVVPARSAFGGVEISRGEKRLSMFKARLCCK